MDPKPLLPTIHSRRPRRYVLPVLACISITIWLTVLLLPHKRDIDLNSANGLPINGDRNVSFIYLNHSHWLPESNLDDIRKLVHPYLILLDSTPKSNMIVHKKTNTTIIFRAKVLSMKECAIITKACNRSFFTYESTTQLCYINEPPSSMVIDIGVDSLTRKECVTACFKTIKCVGMIFEEQMCSLYKPTYNEATIMSGWIRPSSKKSNGIATTALRANITRATKLNIFGVAHQDDRELFMPTAMYNAFKDPSTKNVFIYTTSGDANRTDGWWQAREVGALAATDFAVQEFGFYSTSRKTEIAHVMNHSIHKVIIGNAVHYFLRLSEERLSLLFKAPVNVTLPPAPPLDRTNETYSSIQDVRDVVREIISIESKGIPTVSVHVNEFINQGRDHELHSGTGSLVAGILALDEAWKTCVSTTFYYGYAHWLDTPNVPEPYLTFQRRLWLALATALGEVYPAKDVWSNHAMNLGRSYISRVVNATTLCPV